MDNSELLKRRIAREIKARKNAEKILENKAQELFEANEKLKQINETLEQEIENKSKAIISKEKQYRGLIENASDIIYNIDLEGYFTYVNPTGLKTIGLSAKELIGTHFIDFVREDYQEAIVSFYEKSISSEEEQSYYEFPLYNKNGKEYWIGQRANLIYNDGKPSHFAVIARDITKQKKFEHELIKIKKELEVSEIKYRSIIENMELGLIEVNKQGIIQNANSIFCEMVGFPESELIGEYPSIFLSNEDSQIQGTTEYNLYNLPDMAPVFEKEIISKSKTSHWHMISGAPFFDVSGQINGFVGIHYDISPIKKLQEELIKTRNISEVDQDSHLQFLSKLTGEIGSPLGHIFREIKILRSSQLSTDPQYSINSISKFTIELDLLLSNVLQIFKLEYGSIEMKGEPFNIEEVTKNACNYFTNILPAEVFTIEVSFAENIPAPIIGNQELVAQLLLFLINKAYLPTAPSNLHLSLSLHKATESQIFIRFTLNEKTVSKKRSHLYSIDELKDPPKHQKDPLLIHSNITNIVNLLNGEILTKDKEDEFDITIPFEIYSKSSNKWLENTEMTIGKLNFPFPILVVEDNHLNQKYLARLLQKWNLTFEIAENGLEGFEKAISTEYSIILMDLQMPVMDGFESAKKMRKSDVPYLKKIPIIALSASTLLTWTDQVIRSGMNDFLSKPFTPDQLFSTLNKYNSSIGEKSPNSIMDFEFTFNPVLDHHYLETIYQDDLEYAYEMFDIFVESIPVELQKLLQYMRKSNHEGVQKLAHKLKPTFAMVGLTEIKDLFQEIENATKNKDISYLSYLKKLENIDTQLDLIKKERDRLRSYLA